MWEQMTADIREHGGEVRLNAPVTRLRIEGGKVLEVVAGGETLVPSHVISSLPLRAVVEMASPPPPQEVLDAARGLRYRDFLTVALVVDGEDLFPDNWIYIHEPAVRVGRIQNYRSWSPWMVPDPDKACVGLEYFCFEGDDLWTMDDAALVELASRELEQLRLSPQSKVERGFAIRVPKAYPIYDADYRARPDDSLLARRDREPPAGRAQRPPPLQQLGPLDAHGDARRRQPARRRAPRHLGRERGERLSRDRGRGRAPVPAPLPRRPRCRRSLPLALSKKAVLPLATTLASVALLVWSRAADGLVDAAERRRGADASDQRLLVRAYLPHRLDEARRRAAALVRQAVTEDELRAGSRTRCRSAGRSGRT